MQFIPFTAGAFVPASHEDPRWPGVLKKVLLKRDDLRPGRLQMVNWSILAVGKQFALHYHEDMQEIFIGIAGEAEIAIAGETFTMRRGDTVVIDARELHQMRNTGQDDFEYLAVGVAGEANGKTVVVE